jgi:hypothetical protein
MVAMVFKCFQVFFSSVSTAFKCMLQLLYFDVSKSRSDVASLLPAFCCIVSPGLVSARELLREGHDVTVMEQSGGVGGQWLYDPRSDGGAPLGVAGAQSSIYASLRLNTPRESMGFSDFPFFPATTAPATTPSGTRCTVSS